MFVFFSTPGIYADVLRNSNIDWSIYEGDFFPYADTGRGGEDTKKDYNYWTGYFTSRQGGKKQLRDGQSLLNAFQVLATKSLLQENVPKSIIDNNMVAKWHMLDTIGVYLHHDAITGTSM